MEELLLWGYDVAPDGTYVINEYEAIAVKKFCL